MKVMISGGAGFIGSHIVDKLLAEGHEPLVLDNLSTGKRSNLPPGVPFVLGDICDIELVRSVLSKGFDAVMHLAAQKSVVGAMADPIFDEKVNVQGTLNLLTTAAENGISRFSFAGTGGAIYGETDQRPTREDHRPSPESPYGISKQSAEQYILHFAQRFNISSAILRLANVYGPRQDHNGEGGVVAIFSRRAMSGQPVDIYGDGEQTRDYVYVGDVAEAFVRTLSLQSTVVANVGTGIETSVNELWDTIVKSSGSRSVSVSQAARAGEVRFSSLDNTRAAEVLCWSPKTSLAEGVRETIGFFADAERLQLAA